MMVDDFRIGTAVSPNAVNTETGFGTDLLQIDRVEPPDFSFSTISLTSIFASRFSNISLPGAESDSLSCAPASRSAGD
jgi:hypothetical protein